MNTGVEAHYERKNNDKQCSKYGMSLIDLCKTANLVIVKGRMTNASSSNTTFGNIITIDYFLCCPLLFKYINNFIVHENNPMFSDGHSALELSIDTALIVEVGVQICKNPIVSRQHVKWEHNKITEFQCALNDNTDGFEKVNNLSDMLLANISETTKENVSELVSRVNDLLLCGAKECNMIKVKHYNKKHTNIMPRSNNWFDMECKDKRNAFNRARRRYRDNKSEENLNQMRLAGKDYKVIINKAKAAEKHKFIQELRAKETKDPKSFWQIINTNSNKIKKTGNVTIEDFFDHFSELNSVVEINEGQTEDSPTSNETLTCNCITDKYSDMLNSPISEDEVKKAVKRLKNGKACGEDKILNEMIKAFSESHMSVLTKIFYIVLLSGHMPHEWVIGIIKPIYKNKGDINDPDNYRGITLLSCFGKLFTSILNDRLTTYINLNEMMSEAQAGFRKGYSTTDQIFTLKCIVELLLCQGRRLFCTFVDYSKAFDSINRATLWKMLFSYGITGKVIDVIINMYKSIKSCVMDTGIQ